MAHSPVNQQLSEASLFANVAHYRARVTQLRDELDLAQFNYTRALVRLILFREEKRNEQPSDRG